MEGIKMIPIIVLAICIAGVVAGAGALVLSNFGDTMTQCWNTSFTYNTTVDRCTNDLTSLNTSAAGPNDENFSYEYYSVREGSAGILTVAEQFPTVGIIGVLVIIISLLAGVFAYMKYFG